MESFGSVHFALIALFVLGYSLIALEHTIQLNKSAIAIALAVLSWTILFLNQDGLSEKLSAFIAEDAQIVLFLLGALTIVEIIHLHKGFAIITDLITVRSKRKFVWIIGSIAFLLSAVIDNLTTTVVMISIVSKLVKDREDRLLMGGAIVIAANAGGAFSPIGDVTTTMLWIDGKLSVWPIIRDLFLPSLTCFVIATLVLARKLRGELTQSTEGREKIEPRGTLVFFAGAAALIFVPIFKFQTGLPPMMGVLLGLGFLWMLTDVLHYRYDGPSHLLIPVALSRIDTSSILFFLGVLLSVNALEQVHLLHALAAWMQTTFANVELIAFMLGALSAVIDNVPLVAASMGMYDTSQFPPDSQFWQLIAYCAGTGGSMLAIGSAAGVVFMGLEMVGFVWYLRHITLAAAAGYVGGILVYLIT